MKWGKKFQTVLPCHIHKDALAPPSSFSAAWRRYTPFHSILTPNCEPACSGEAPGGYSRCRDNRSTKYHMSTAISSTRVACLWGNRLTHLEVPPKQSKTPSTPSPKEKLFIPLELQHPPPNNSICQLLTMLERKKSPTGEADRVTQRAVTVIGTLKERQGNQL